MLSLDQQQALDMWLSRKTLNVTQEDIAKQFNTTSRSLRRWISSEEGKLYMQQRQVEVAKESLPEVLDILMKRAREGKNAKFMQMYLQVVGLLGSDSSVNVNVNNQDKEDRSNSAIENSIAELQAELEAMEKAEQEFKLVKGGRE
jgi:gamma-glutamylcysteine synthetase